MAFTAADVKKLREMTNVGMMDCKKALTETDGDMDKAVEWLREKGLAKDATVCEKCGVGAVVEVNCETDFCAKSAPFVEFVKDICKVVLQDNPADVAALMECKYPGTELKVSEVLPEKVMSIGENLQIRRFKRFDKNTSVSYVHAGGKIGVLVNLEVEGGIDATTIGLKGSPTNILTSFTPPQKGAGQMLEGNDMATCEKLAGILLEKHII